MIFSQFIIKFILRNFLYNINLATMELNIVFIVIKKYN